MAMSGCSSQKAINADTKKSPPINETSQQPKTEYIKNYSLGDFGGHKVYTGSAYKVPNTTRTYQPHGKGTLYVNDRKSLEGNFKNGFLDGQGIKYMSHYIGNDHKTMDEMVPGSDYETVIEYEGGFKNGEYDGKGKLYNITWVYPGKPGEGKYYLYYEGDFFNGHEDREGSGTYYYPDGTVKYKGKLSEMPTDLPTYREKGM